MSADPVSGGCLCGAVRFEIDGPLRDIVVCHCSLCRRAGTNAAAYTSAPEPAVRLVGSSEPAVYVDSNGRERSFCPTCGSLLFWSEGDDRLSISAGALDTDAGLHVRRHIHADSAAGWETLPEGVPTHREGSSSPLVSDGDQ
jgi:hypothetical protein